jgi:hypothetical protein
VANHLNTKAKNKDALVSFIDLDLSVETGEKQGKLSRMVPCYC